MSPRAREPDPDITARPKSIARELKTRTDVDEGLSLDPDELGREFLNDATEQDNFESSLGGDATELSLPGPSPSDDPLVGPHVESDQSLWESTVDLAVESGGPDEPLEAAPVPVQENPESPEDAEEVDLLGDSIREGSLFDHEGKQPGEVKSPRVRADETLRR